MYCTLGECAIRSKYFFLVLMKVLFISRARLFSVPSHYSVFILEVVLILDLKFFRDAGIKIALNNRLL